MEEIILALNKWEALRKDAGALAAFFNGVKGFQLNMADFPIGEAIHAYPAIKDDRLYFITISEVYDVSSSMGVLTENSYWLECKEVLNNNGGQEIPPGEALDRIIGWDTTFPSWITDKISEDGEMYQTFSIPTSDLQPEVYSVYFALKNPEINTGLKAADLVLKSNTGLFFDTVRAQPPYADRQRYFLLDLI